MKTLTTAEEEVMQHLWKLEEATVGQLVEMYLEPRPAYNTVSTIVRILETKGFIDHSKQGRGYLYHPTIEKDEYSKATVRRLAGNYFKGSFKSMVSFFMQQNDLTVNELEELLDELKKTES